MKVYALRQISKIGLYRQCSVSFQVKSLAAAEQCNSRVPLEISTWFALAISCNCRRDEES